MSDLKSRKEKRENEDAQIETSNVNKNDRQLCRHGRTAAYKLQAPRSDGSDRIITIVVCMSDNCYSAARSEIINTQEKDRATLQREAKSSSSAQRKEENPLKGLGLAERLALAKKSKR